MSRSDPYAFASLAAEQLIKGFRITALPIDPLVIARERGIEVVAKPARDAGVSGMLIRVGNEFAIAYATHIDNEPFQRFSVSHELGHYFLPGHVDASNSRPSGRPSRIKGLAVVPDVAVLQQHAAMP